MQGCLEPISQPLGTIRVKALVVPWHQFVYTLFIPCGRLVIQNRILQVFIICEAFASKVLLHFWKQEKIRRCQVRTIRRLLEDVPMELLTQQGLCLEAVCGYTLSCNRTIPRDSLPVRQENLRFHRPAENE